MKAPASTAQAHLVPGFRLDRYELLYAYAQGGMATVWLARLRGKHGFEKLVAIKTILPGFASDPIFRTMLLDEARIAARIQHPNVAEIDDLGEHEGTLYIVLEWIDGDSLSKLFSAVVERNEPFPLGLTLRVCADACAGLHAAHGLRDETGMLLNVVHRDVSPQNILVSTAGVTKVIDFGIAKARDRMGERTATGLLKGKPEFAAPEQALMQAVDQRADVWAMGVVLYQMLTGTLPFTGKTDLDTLRAVTSGKAPKPLPKSVPQAVADVVYRTLKKNPDERFGTALDMQRAIEAAMPSPFSTADVSAFVETYLAERIAKRRAEVGRAVTEARARAEERARRRSRPELASFADLGDARPGSAPALGDMILGSLGPSEAASPAPFELAAPPPAVPLDLAPAPVAAVVAPLPAAREGRVLRGRHVAAMVLSLAVTVSVWGSVVVIAQGAPSASASASATANAPVATSSATASVTAPATADPPAAASSAAPAASSAPAVASSLPAVASSPPVAAAAVETAPPVAAAPVAIPPGGGAALPAVVPGPMPKPKPKPPTKTTHDDGF